MANTHVRGAGRALGLILATTTAAVLPAALGSPGTYAAPRATSTHATHGSTQPGVRAKGAGERTLPQAPCWTVGVFLADVGCDLRTTTGGVTYSIRGVDAWYSVKYFAPGASSWNTCVEGRRGGIFGLNGVCAVPIGSWVSASALGVVGVLSIGEQH
jgi:hypothetical protein